MCTKREAVLLQFVQKFKSHSLPVRVSPITLRHVCNVGRHRHRPTSTLREEGKRHSGSVYKILVIVY